MKHINSVFFDTSPISKTKTIKNLFIRGDIGAVFSVYVVRNNDNYYYNFNTKSFQAASTRLLQKEIINNNKTYIVKIVFPTVTADKNYDVYVYAESHFDTSFNSDFEESLLYRVKNIDNRLNKDGTYYLNSDTKLPSSLYQYADKTITISTLHSDSAVTEAVNSSKTNTNLNVSGADFTFLKPRGKVYSNVTNRLSVVDNPENKATANFLPAMGLVNHSMQLARKPILNDFFVTTTQTVNGATSSSTDVILDSVDNIYVGMKIQSVSSGSLTANTHITKINQETKLVTMSQSNSFADGITLTLRSYGLSNIYNLFKTRLKIANLTGALSTVTHPDTGQSTEFNFVTTKKSSDLTTGVNCDVTTTKGLGTGDTIFAAGLTTGDGTADGTPITIASITDSDTIVLTDPNSDGNALANNSTILENTVMFFKGSSLTADISFDIEFYEIGDTNFTLFLDLDNILTITDES
tara:strand:- start:397 stop:1794 length:1398 start_codon:yes stop_codon:yes gene_type:complete